MGTNSEETIKLIEAVMSLSSNAEDITTKLAELVAEDPGNKKLEVYISVATHQIQAYDRMLKTMVEHQLFLEEMLFKKMRALGEPVPEGE